MAIQVQPPKFRDPALVSLEKEKEKERKKREERVGRVHQEQLGYTGCGTLRASLSCYIFYTASMRRWTKRHCQAFHAVFTQPSSIILELVRWP
jgi:hypothetical protein